MASTALAPAFDQWRLAPSSRFPTMQLQALSTMPDPIGDRAYGRGRSAFGPCWPRRCGCRPRRLRTGRGAATERRLPGSRAVCDISATLVVHVKLDRI